MESETSAIARKLQNFIVLENEEHEFHGQKKEEPGIFKNALMIALMATAVFFTQITLVLVRWSKSLEE